MNRLLRPISYLAKSRLGQIGVALTTAAGITIGLFFTSEYFGIHMGPYAGIIGFIGLPVVLVGGLMRIAKYSEGKNSPLVIPAGVVRARPICSRRLFRRYERGLRRRLISCQEYVGLARGRQ